MTSGTIGNQTGIPSEREFDALGRALSEEAKVLDGLHGYFVEHRSRLYKSCGLFKLLADELGDVLEIGPFYGYTPFLLRPRARSYVVLEGDDPVAYPLRAPYEKRQIQVRWVDLFEIFGPTHTAKHALDFPDNSFDTLLCWETMEHFNFNPVKFVRELYRVLRPGGRACITVPNKASLQNVAGLLSVRYEAHVSSISSYYRFEDYVCNGKKAFYGFHWREYSATELRQLFERAGFTIRQSGTFVAFHAAGQSPGRRLVQAANRVLAGLLSRYGTHVRLAAEKPAC
jgi:SAM-dependent methyltransferase